MSFRSAATSPFLRTAVLLGLSLAACGDDPADPRSDGDAGAGVDAAVGPAAEAKIRVTPTSGLATTEGGATAAITVELTDKPTAEVTIRVRTDDAGEGRVEGEVVVFEPDDWAPRTVQVHGVDDSEQDGNHGYQVVFDDATSDDLRYQGQAVSDVAVTNLDDDTAGVTLVREAPLSTRESGTTATIAVRLNSRPSGEVIVRLRSSAPDEVTLARDEVRFYPVTWDAVETVLLTGVDDAVADGDQEVTIITERVQSTDVQYLGLDPEDVVVTNTDDETASIQLSSTGPFTLAEWSSTHLTVRLTSQPTAMVEVHFTPDSTRLQRASVAFTPDDWRAKTITLTPDNNRVDDGDVTVTVRPSIVTRDETYQALTLAPMTVVITDDDQAGVILDAPTWGRSTEESNPPRCVEMTVRIASQPTADVTVALTSSIPGEGVVSPGSVSFGRWSSDSGRTVSVCGVDDHVVDGTRRYDIIAQARSTDPLYNAAAEQRLEFTNVDNDRVEMRVVGARTTTESGGTATLQVHLAARPASTVTMRVSSSDPGEGLASVDTLTFAPETWNVAQTVIVTGQDDSVIDRGQSYTLDFGPFVSDDVNWTSRTDSVWLTNSDND